MNYFYKFLTLALGALILFGIIFLGFQWANITSPESRFDYLDLGIMTVIVGFASFKGYKLMSWTWLAGTTDA